jgi:hypothetical protein
VFALQENTTGTENTATDAGALAFNTTGGNNTAIGDGALLINATGTGNTAIGRDALFGNTGTYNIGIGAFAGSVIPAGDHNIIIGHPGVVGDSFTTRIGSNTQTQTFISGIFGATTGASGCRSTSIAAAGSASFPRPGGSRMRSGTWVRRASASSGSGPVTFRYTQAPADGSRVLQYGLIAEEVAEVYPELVAYDLKTGEPKTVLYHELLAMMLNELQKQHQQLEAQVSQLKTQSELIAAQAAALAALRARLATLEAALAGPGLPPVAALVESREVAGSQR